MSTLRDRVTAPTVLTTPEPVGGLTFRPATTADQLSMHAVLAAACALDSPQWHPSPEDISHMLSTTGLDPERDTLVGVDAGGHVQAYAIVLPVPGRATMVRVIVEGAVHPDHRGRGIGRAVLAWELDRGRQILAASGLDLPGLVEVTEQDGTGVMPLAARAGMRPLRYWIEMEHRIGDDSPTASRTLPDGLVLRPATDADVEPMRIAKNDSFRDHWGSQPMLEADWAKYLRASTARLDLSRVVVDIDGRVVAFTVSDVDPDAFAARGSRFATVHWVGVVRDHRGLGLAPTVLGATIDAARAAGLEAVVLDVDAENPSGALGLYERLGFDRTETSVTAALQF